MQITRIITLLYLSIATSCIHASHKSETIVVGTQKVNVTHWYKTQSDDQSNKDSQPTIVLLSGPTDNWNSDSAWFARIAPKLAETHKVISIDRPGQILKNVEANVGYTKFGSMLDQILQQLKVKELKILSFATANLALHQYLSQPPSQVIRSIIMIDPDVLMPYSISRYKKDAKPFKENIDQYISYIESGKYDERALQKNTAEKTHLQTLSNGDQETDWEYVNTIFSHRLDKNNLINLFREIAVYDQDLDQALKTELPSNIAITIIDTDFEQAYIDKSDDQVVKDGLYQWKSEASQYYRQLTAKSLKGQYIKLTTKEHLLPFSQPALLLELLKN